MQYNFAVIYLLWPDLIILCVWVFGSVIKVPVVFHRLSRCCFVVPAKASSIGLLSAYGKRQSYLDFDLMTDLVTDFYSFLGERGVVVGVGGISGV